MNRKGRSRFHPLSLLLIGLIVTSAMAANDTGEAKDQTSATATNDTGGAKNKKDKKDKKDKDDDEAVMTVRKTAEQELKQQPGVSIITADDIAKNPPVNDLSDIIRKMPGVNLTGNSATGSRGNNRQIDIRGMGPENTLILVDGIPVTSRSSVRYSWRGERDSRGDSNWVPVEMVDRIEVLRGPAAARYGSGAAGGVVNIITKRPTKHWRGSVSLFTNQPENSKEGDTKRVNFNLSGPLIGDVLTMRLYGNLNKTDADAADINHDKNGSYAAGREGVRNKDVNAMLSWKMTPSQIVDVNYGYSRQGNIYAGDTQNSNSNISPHNYVSTLYGRETNRLYRQSYGITHNGFWEWGTSKLNASYEKTNNSRMNEGSAGRVEGMITNDDFKTSQLQNYRTSGEVNIPIDRWLEQTLTLGAEWDREELDDPASIMATNDPGVSIAGVPGNAAERSTKNRSTIGAIYFEDNIEPFTGTHLIPGLRFDHHNRFGGNWSPSLNLSQDLGQYFKFKTGIAREFKAPNLYQSSEGYLLVSRGRGCPKELGNGGCYLMGNGNLDAEISVNKEAGLEFAANGYAAGMTWFRNDYKNKIVSGTDIVGVASNGYQVLRWENGGKSIVQGLEANLDIPVVSEILDWRTNATYMIESKNKQTGNPLSIIPKYTINSMLDYKITEKLSSELNWTLYGRQKPRKYSETKIEETLKLSTDKVAAYSIIGLNLNYQATKNLRLNGGISNMLDKKIYRSNEGASTYNEPGRAYYAGVTVSF